MKMSCTKMYFELCFIVSCGDKYQICLKWFVASTWHFVCVEIDKLCIIFMYILFRLKTKTSIYCDKIKGY